MAQLNYRVVSQPYVGTEADLQDVLFPIRTSAQLADSANRINTEDKFTGKLAYDSTLGVPVWASGASINAPWVTSNPALATEAGAGITDGVGTVYRSSVQRAGGIITTQILINLSGLSSATSVLDIIGVGANPAHLGQIVTVNNGILLGGIMTCLELPDSLTDIDLYSATESTGVFEDNESTLTATELLAKGGAWSAGDATILTALPAADEFLYLMNGVADIADPFVAGRFLIELYGYDA